MKTVPPPEPAKDAETPVVNLGSALFKEVQITLSARLGELTLTVDELLRLKAGSVVKLDTRLNDFVELQLNQSTVARGELVAVGDHFGIRIIEITPHP